METPESDEPTKELPAAPKKPIEPPSFDPIPPERPKKSKGWLSTLATGLVVVLIVALGGGIVYLLSDLNSRHYRLTRAGDMMVVEKGKFMPTGFQTYRPKEPGLSRIYQPVKVPEGGDVPQGDVYEDRADLDRAMFATLAGWARQALQQEGDVATLAAETYIERCDILPGVSEEQRRDIKTLRADLAYRSGRRLLDGVVHQLKTAAGHFEKAIELGTSYANEAASWLQEVQARITSLTEPKVELEGSGETPEVVENKEDSGTPRPESEPAQPQASPSTPEPAPQPAEVPPPAPAPEQTPGNDVRL